MDFRMGKPTFEARYSSPCFTRVWMSGFYMKVFNPEYIGVKSEPGELKHLSTRRKGHQYETPLVVASERGSGLMRKEAEQSGKAGLSG